MSDPETLAVYDAKAGEYARRFGSRKPGEHLMAFMDDLPAGGTVLDLGCGPGSAAALMQAEGLVVDCVDASAAMVEAARERGLTARQASFDEIEGTNIYDGIWANFSLLHAERDTLSDHLARLAAALRPKGIFHIGMKLGTGETRDALGRYYTFVTEAELDALLADASFTPLRRWHGEEAGLAGTVDPWIVVQARNG